MRLRPINDYGTNLAESSRRILSYIASDKELDAVTDSITNHSLKIGRLRLFFLFVVFEVQ